jgi:hypothetical protein
MSRNKWWAKLLRIIGIVLMSLTAAFTLLGGAGTSCVALNPTKWPSFARIAPFQWLWILFVLIGLAAGVMGVRAVVLLVKGRKNAYRYALIALLLGIAINLIHLFASRALRNGSSMPVDMVLYTNILTLVVFLIFRIPGIWQGVNFEKPAGENNTGRLASAIALFAAGLLSLTIQFMMAPTHTINGLNYADVWHAALTLIGVALILGGCMAVVRTRLSISSREALELH